MNGYKMVINDHFDQNNEQIQLVGVHNKIFR